MYSSEIETAIKIGKTILGMKAYNLDTVKFKAVLDKLDIDLTRFPTHDVHLSKDLRQLTNHAGDRSFDYFLADQISYGGLKGQEKIVAFLRGIFYIYPPSSAQYIIKGWNEIMNSSIPDIHGIELYVNNVLILIKAQHDKEEKP